MSKFWKVKANRDAGYDNHIEVPLLKKDELPDDVEVDTFARKNRKLGKEGKEGITSISVDGSAYPIGIDDNKGLRRIIGYFQDDNQQYHGVVSGAYGFVLLLFAIIVAVIAAISLIYPVSQQYPDSDTAIVPPVVGMTVQNATKDIEAVGLKWKINGTDDDDSVVTSESPNAYSSVAKGTVVTLVTREAEHDGNNYSQDSANSNASNSNVSAQNTNKNDSVGIYKEHNENKNTVTNNDNTVLNTSNENKIENNNTVPGRATTITASYNSGEALDDGTAAVKINSKLSLNNLSASVTLKNGTTLNLIEKTTGNESARVLADPSIIEMGGLDGNGSVYASMQEEKTAWNNDEAENVNSENFLFNIALLDFKAEQSINIDFAVIDPDNKYSPDNTILCAFGIGGKTFQDIQDFTDGWSDRSKLVGGIYSSIADLPEYFLFNGIQEMLGVDNSWTGDIVKSTDTDNLKWNTMTLTAPADGIYYMFFIAAGNEGTSFVVNAPTIRTVASTLIDGASVEWPDLSAVKDGNAMITVNYNKNGETASTTVPLHVHDYNNGFIKWAEDGSAAANATFHCTYDPSHIENVSCTVTQELSSTPGYIDYVAVATSSTGTTLTETKTVEVTGTLSKEYFRAFMSDCANDTSSVTFVDSGVTDTTDKVDVSEEQNKTVWAWVDGADIKVSNIKANTKVKAPVDCSELFRDRGNLITIDGLSKLDTSSTTNMSYMFSAFGNVSDIGNASLLTTIKELDTLDTSQVTNMSDMFRSCYSLKSFDVSHFNTTNVKDMTWMFDGVYNLSDNTTDACFALDLTAWDVSNVEDMYGTFANQRLFSSIDVTGWDTSKVTDMAWMFAEGSSSNLSTLTEIKGINTWDTSKVTSMVMMFNFCSALTSLDVSNFNTSNVKNMSRMFAGCYKLHSLDVTHFDTANAQSMSSMFESCYLLEKLDVTHFNTSNVKDMSWMFAQCYALKEIDLSNFDTSKVTDIGSMFLYCSKLTNIPGISNINTANITNMQGYGSGEWGVFCGCSSLKELDLSSWDTSKTTRMGFMFCGCSSLKELNISNFNTSNVTDMESMFRQCGIECLNLQSFDTSNVTNMSLMFAGAMSLQHINVSSKWNTSKVTNSYVMFGKKYTYGSRLYDWAGEYLLHNFDSNYTDKTKAIIDDGTNGGYLERKTAAALISSLQAMAASNTASIINAAIIEPSANWNANTSMNTINKAANTATNDEATVTNVSNGTAQSNANSVPTANNENNTNNTTINTEASSTTNIIIPGYANNDNALVHNTANTQ